MSTEDLMKPRYKVINDYPGNVQPIGHVFEVIGDLESIEYWCAEKERYPSIFKKLSWWEERDEKDMPGYLKHTLDGQTTFHKIIRWNMEMQFGIEHEEGNKMSGCSILLWSPEYTYLPATESEYLEYLSNK